MKIDLEFLHSLKVDLMLGDLYNSLLINQSLTLEEEDLLILDFLNNDNAQNLLYFPCYHCGRRMNLKQYESHICHPIDEILTTYIKYYHLSDKDMNKMIKKKKEIYKRYPTKLREGYLLYRGFNFNTKQDLFKFLDSIKNDKLIYKKLSSWTTSFDIAKNFACNINDEKTEDNALSFGVVLSTKLKKNMILADISNKLTNFHENEIILMPGKINIQIEEIY